MTRIEFSPWRSLKWQFENRRLLSHFIYCSSKKSNCCLIWCAIAHHILVSMSFSWTSTSFFQNYLIPVTFMEKRENYLQFGYSVP